MTKGAKIGFATGGVILVGIIGFVLFQLFSHSSDLHLKVVPKEAAAVLKINTKALALKADLLKLLREPAFKKTGSGKSTLTQLISNPFESGIDPIENVYGFLSKVEENTISAIIFRVADEDDLEKFIKSLSICQSIFEESGIHHAIIDEHRSISWNEEAGIIIAVSGGNKQLIAKKYLEQGKAESILAVSNYNSFAEKKFDIGLFLDNKILSRMSSATDALSALGFVNGYGELLLNFENDKIETSYSNYTDVAVTTSILNNKGPLANHFSAVAPKTPLVYLGFSSDVNQLFKTIEADVQLKQNLEDMEVYMNVPGSELKKLFTGDGSIAFTDYLDISGYDPRVGFQVEKMMKNDSGAERNEFALNTPMAYINLGITDDTKANQILDEIGFMKTDNFYAMPGLNFIVYAAAKDGHLVITNDYYAAETISTLGKFPAVIPSTISKTNPFVFWADLDQKHFPIALTESLKNDFTEETVNFFLDLTKPFKSVRMESTKAGSQIDIHVEPGTGNSLYRLLSYYGNFLN